MLPDTSPTDVAAAAQNAGRLSPTFAASSTADRRALLIGIADALEAHRGELVPLAISETHLPQPRLDGELSRASWQLRMFSDLITDHQDIQTDLADPDWPAGGRPKLQRVLQPIGPVLVFPASNFPFAFSVAGTDTASALAAGCPVIVKTHPGHPELSRRTGQILADVIGDHGQPEGLVSLISGQDAGIRAITHPAVRAAAFTGSTRAGRVLFDLANDRAQPIPFYGELGSLNPVLLTEKAISARRSEILNGLVTSYTLSAGQFCTKPGLVAIPSGSGIETELAELAAQVPPASMLNDNITTGYLESIHRVLAVDGVKTLLQPHQGSVQGPALAVVSTDDFINNSAELQTECFGPMTLLITYTDVADLTEIISRLEGQLTATIHSQPAEPGIRELVTQLSLVAGRIIHNGWPTGVAVSPAMTHGGPYPATTTPLHTSVGTHAIDRFLRPVTYQNMPDDLLPTPFSGPSRHHPAKAAS